MYTINSRCPGKTWEEKEANILKKCKPLVIKGYSLTEYDDTLEDFIHNFLVLYNHKYETTTLEALDGRQCRAGAHRSLVDIFLICKHYFPDCTLKGVKDALYSNGDGLGARICGTIHRRVYELKVKHPGFTTLDEGTSDELGFTYRQLKEN